MTGACGIEQLLLWQDVRLETGWRQQGTYLLEGKSSVHVWQAILARSGG